MSDPVPLKLARLTARDLQKIAALGEKVRLTHRWFRSEAAQDGTGATLYSGDRGPLPYAAYRIARHADGVYELTNARTGQWIAAGRTIDSALAALPDDFFYAAKQ